MRLSLEPLTAAHTECLVELDGDAEVMRFLTGRGSTRDEVVRTWMPRLRRDAWGHGYAVEGAPAVVEHGFNTVGLRLIVAETMAVNTASRRVMERIGMRHVHTDKREWDEPLPGAGLGEVVDELAPGDRAIQPPM